MKKRETKELRREGPYRKKEKEWKIILNQDLQL